MVESLKDKYLLFKAKKGSPLAIAELFDRYFQKIYRFVYFRVGSREDAEDVTGDVFLQFQNHLYKGGDVKSVSGLLYQIARNKVIDFYRTRKIPSVPLDQMIVGEESLKNLREFVIGTEDAKLETSAEIQSVLRAMEWLKPEYKEILLLHYINELTVRELAEALEKKENNIRVMLFRALAALREELARPDKKSTEHDEQKINQNFKESPLARGD